VKTVGTRIWRCGEVIVLTNKDNKDRTIAAVGSWMPGPLGRFDGTAQGSLIAWVNNDCCRGRHFLCIGDEPVVLRIWSGIGECTAPRCLTS
jgi:hypothetical protein